MSAFVRTLGVAVIGLTTLACKSPDKKQGDRPGPSPGSAAQRAPDQDVAGTRLAPPRPIARPPGGPVELAVLEQRRREAIEALAFEEAAVPRLCLRPRPVDVSTINVDRSLFVHDRATLDALGPDTFSLRRTLAKIADDAVAAGAAGATPETLFRDLWDTQNDRMSAATPKEGAQCDDDNTTLNGFPNACRVEADGLQAKAPDLAAEIASYRPVALVNRLDLAAEGWQNCGEHRIVFGRAVAGAARSFLIFEAVLPNPRPGCATACRPVAQHWYALSAMADPAMRARHLERLFYTGLPGFRPVVHVDHYAARGPMSGYGGSGSGQIRTNQFLEGPWMLKELKLALDCTNLPCKLDPIPIPVKINPHGPLWTESDDQLAGQFQQSVLAQVDRLSINDLNRFSYEVPVPFDAARSESQTGGLLDNYLASYTAGTARPGGFQSLLAGRTAPMRGLTDRHIVNRATALSCAGCHQPRTFGLVDRDAIGVGMSWPDSAGFVHVRGEEQNGVHALSPALENVFLPFRASNLAAFLSERACLCRFRPPRFPFSVPDRDILARPPTTAQDLRDAEQKLKQRIDRDLVRQGKPRLPALEPDLRAQPLILEEVRAAGPDEARRALARRRAVQRLVSEEPPRRTVTGHFRTH